MLTELANSGDAFVKSFNVFLTYPFVDEVVGRDPQVARNLHMGDYTNLSIELDVDLSGGITGVPTKLPTLLPERARPDQGASTCSPAACAAATSPARRASKLLGTLEGLHQAAGGLPEAAATATPSSARRSPRCPGCPQLPGLPSGAALASRCSATCSASAGRRAGPTTRRRRPAGDRRWASSAGPSTRPWSSLLVPGMVSAR